MIISISGLIGSGKDTVADYLVKNHGFQRESWAGTLKDAVASIFSWNRELLEGRTAASRAWRDVPDEWWSKRLGRSITPRRVLQEWGTEVGRQGYHDQIWIASLENKLRHVECHTVITDTRFPNELQSVKDMGGTTLRIVRGPDPDWVPYYIANGYTVEFKNSWPGVHASEYSSVGLDYDHIIENNGSIQDLHYRINDLVQSLQGAR